MEKSLAYLPLLLPFIIKGRMNFLLAYSINCGSDSLLRVITLAHLSAAFSLGASGNHSVSFYFVFYLVYKNRIHFGEGIFKNGFLIEDVLLHIKVMSPRASAPILNIFHKNETDLWLIKLHWHIIDNSTPIVKIRLSSWWFSLCQCGQVYNCKYLIL